MRDQGYGQGRRRLLVAIAAVLAAMVGTAALGVAQETQRDLPAFGMLGLARGQVAVLSLVDVDARDRDRAACRMTAAFVDARGVVFRDAAGNLVQQTFVLRPNVAATLRLSAADILGDGEQRKATRVVLTDVDDGVVSSCDCVMAMREHVNANGRTTIADVGIRPDDGGNPPPPPRCQQDVIIPSPPPGR
jgi:hypothetical protein